MNVPDPKLASRPRILIVDDDPSLARQLEWGLSDEYEVQTALGPVEALNAAAEFSPDAVTLDLGLRSNDPATGFAVLERLLDLDPLLKVILVTGHDTREHALQAVGTGAYDFFPKPVDIDLLRTLLRRAVIVRRLEQENAVLRSQVGQANGPGGLRGQSRAITEVRELVRKVAPTDVTVLVSGEAGTGREATAREIHELSGRATRPFVTVSCAGISESMLLKDLFGETERGNEVPLSAREGKLQRAEGGTIFLEDVDQLPLAVQLALAQSFQEQAQNPKGTVSAGAPRIIASTQADLRAAVASGTFREDLFFRLSVVNIHIPPLRQRPEDVVLLAQHFLTRYGAEFGRHSLTLGREALRALQHHAWPGNVRELEHTVQRAVVLARGRRIRAADLDIEVKSSQEPISLREAREDAERAIVSDALRRTCGNIARAARELEISRPTLHDLLRKLELQAGDFKDGVGPAEDKEGK